MAESMLLSDKKCGILIPVHYKETRFSALYTINLSSCFLSMLCSMYTVMKQNHCIIFCKALNINFYHI